MTGDGVGIFGWGAVALARLLAANGNAFTKRPFRIQIFRCVFCAGALMRNPKHIGFQRGEGGTSNAGRKEARAHKTVWARRSPPDRPSTEPNCSCQSQSCRAGGDDDATAAQSSRRHDTLELRHADPAMCTARRTRCVASFAAPGLANVPNTAAPHGIGAGSAPWVTTPAPPHQTAH